jgi:hypothetical protein
MTHGKRPKSKNDFSRERKTIPEKVVVMSIREGVEPYASDYLRRRKGKSGRDIIAVTLFCTWTVSSMTGRNPELRGDIEKREVSRKWVEQQARREPATLYYLQRKDQFMVFGKSDALQRMFLFEDAIPLITYLPKHYFRRDHVQHDRAAGSAR